MKNKAFLMSTQIAVMVLALSSVSVAEGPRSTTLKGTINDYNPFAMEGTRFAERGRSRSTLISMPSIFVRH